MTDSAKNIQKKQWLIMVGGAFGLIAILIVGMWISDPNKGKPDPREVARQEAQEVKKTYKARSVAAVSSQDRWISKSEKELQEMAFTNRQLTQRLQELEKRLEKQEESQKNAGINGSQTLGTPVNGSAGSLPPPPNMNNLPVVTPGSPALPIAVKEKRANEKIRDEVANNLVPPGPSASDDGKSYIQIFNFEDPKAAKKGNKKIKNVSHALPSGSFGKIILLSGADAPTGGEAEKNPVPVLMKLQDLGTLPNFFQSEIKNCHLTGAMRGDLSSERGKIRTERLSCVLINGDIVDVNAEGWINGEDGKEGFRGNVVEKTGSLLARSFISGTFAGLGENVVLQQQSISQSALGSVSTLDPNKATKAGFAQGAATGADMLAEYYMERANEMYPIIEISSGRVGEWVLTKGIDFQHNIAGNMGN